MSGKRNRNKNKKLKLKPCPFCGGKAEMQVSEPNWDGACNVRVICKNPDCCAHSHNIWDLNGDIASKKWNKRPLERKLAKHICTLLDIFNEYMCDEDLRKLVIGLGEKRIKQNGEKKK